MPERDQPDVATADAAAHPDPTANALAPLRERIDAIDHEIVALLNERAQIALEIGRVKTVTGRRTVRDAQREAAVLEHVTSESAGLFPDPELVALYRKLIAATRRVQHAQKRAASGGRPSPGPATKPRPATSGPATKPRAATKPGPVGAITAEPSADPPGR